jgi:8-oxo-dGTP pyrophosphatase MutT (NUDIX family)
VFPEETSFASMMAAFAKTAAPPAHYAAGVLPIAWVDNLQTNDATPKALFLVGRDVASGAWSDFGGKVERVDKDVASTAAREFWEETYGQVVDARAMRAKLVPGECIPFESRTQNQHPYWTFLVEVPFLPHLRNAFAKQLAFLRHRNVYRTLIEKIDIMYVDWETLISDAFPKRSVFRDTLLQHRDLLAGIARSGPVQWAERCRQAAAS